MRQAIVVTTLAAALLAGWAVPAGAQQSGIVIQNNGVDSTDNAAGADNVRISRAPGNSQSVNAAGLNNEVGTAREKQRSHKDREKNNSEAAPAEPAPTADESQAYAEPVAVPEETSTAPAAAPEVAAQPTGGETTVLRLPSTGSGPGSSVPWAALIASMAAATAGAMGLRRGQAT